MPVPRAKGSSIYKTNPSPIKLHKVTWKDYYLDKNVPLKNSINI
uniref:Uncharacterized protein n=1 Tax=Anguilla anguilla TaxID=7936 RepID=A0A0E9URH6_ANGAN